MKCSICKNKMSKLQWAAYEGWHTGCAKCGYDLSFSHHDEFSGATVERHAMEILKNFAPLKDPMRILSAAMYSVKEASDYDTMDLVATVIWNLANQVPFQTVNVVLDRPDLFRNQGYYYRLRVGSTARSRTHWIRARKYAKKLILGEYTPKTKEKIIGFTTDYDAPEGYEVVTRSRELTFYKEEL